MQGIFRKENTDKALKYGIYRHLPTYEKIIRNLVSFLYKKRDESGNVTHVCKIREELRRFCIKLKLGKRHVKYDDEK